MARELAKLEPIPALSERRPAQIPSLPAWVASLSDAARTEPQIVQGPDGRTTFRDLLVLPADRMPTAEQRTEIERHIASLRSYLHRTPENSEQAETAMALAITKLLHVLPSARKSEIGEDIRNEAYLDVLDDVPHWAVENAIRRWHRHSCGTDERGRPHDYKWAPDPGTLRVIAMQDVYAMQARIETVAKPLAAVAYVDCSAELERGRLAMRGLHATMKASGDIAALTFETAIEAGRRAECAISPQPATRTADTSPTASPPGPEPATSRPKFADTGEAKAPKRRRSAVQPASVGAS